MRMEGVGVAVPEFVLISILKRLPARCLGRFMVVCKTWRNLILFSPNFSKALHYHNRCTISPFRCLVFQVSTRNDFMIYYAPRRFHILYGHSIVDDGRLHVYGSHEEVFRKGGSVLPPSNKKPKVDEQHKARKKPHYFELVGYCDGVACMLDHSESVRPKPGEDSNGYNNRDCYGIRNFPQPHSTVGMVLWNPTIGTSFSLGSYPDQENLARARGELIFGFGYDPSSSDYKAVRVTCILGLGLLAEVYSLQNQTWSVYDATTTGSGSGSGSSFREVAEPSRGSVFFGGRLHWTYPAKSGNYSILAFDLSPPHGFHEIPVPEILVCHGRPRLMVPKVTREMAVAMMLDMSKWGPHETVQEYLGLVLSSRNEVWVLDKYDEATVSSLWRRMVLKTPGELDLVDIIGPLEMDMDMDIDTDRGINMDTCEESVDIFGRQMEMVSMDDFGRRIGREDQLMVLNDPKGLGRWMLYRLNKRSATTGEMRNEEKRSVPFHHHHWIWRYFHAFEESLVLLQCTMNV